MEHESVYPKPNSNSRYFLQGASVMATTSIFVELLIAGSFALAWMILFYLKASAVNASMIQEFLTKNASHSAWIAGLAVVIAYQVGVIVNFTAYWILFAIREGHWRQDFASQAGFKKFEEMRAVVSQHGSDHILQGLTGTLHFTRIGRTGIFNFLLLSIALFLYDDRLKGIAAICLVFSAASVPVWFMQARRYYRRVGVAYREICKAAKPPSPKTAAKAKA